MPGTRHSATSPRISGCWGTRAALVPESTKEKWAHQLTSQRQRLDDYNHHIHAGWHQGQEDMRECPGRVEGFPRCSFGCYFPAQTDSQLARSNVTQGPAPRSLMVKHALHHTGSKAHKTQAIYICPSEESDWAPGAWRHCGDPVIFNASNDNQTIVLA